ncbi:hypothetical protein [Salinactinospora qingdaonensis]|uniref:Uncharacterized protein n=1 Tax=Salinactinospora qingdaonensis TaxID=702744 RepID=A0ABP7EVL4_9ACTN
MDTETHCLCSGDTKPPEFAAVVGPNEEVTYWSMYSIPEDVTEVTVEIPGFEPVEDVPVQ